MIRKYEYDSLGNKIVCFISIEAILYIIFLFLDIFVQNSIEYSNLVKYLSIILCFLFVIFASDRKNKMDKNLLIHGLFFTLGADWFLLLHNEYFIGVSLFLIVQMIYLLRIENLKSGYDQKKICNHVLIKFGFNIICTIILCIMCYLLGIQLNIFMVIILIYFVSIVHNMLSAIDLAINKPQQQYIIFAIAMILFLLCDINVGIYNSKEFIDYNSKIFEGIYHFSSIGMWLFYLPSQICIALSVLETDGL